MSLCLNCLNTNAKPRPIGPDQGTQMDPYRQTLDLCIECWDYLLKGDMKQFHERFSETRVISR